MIILLLAMETDLCYCEMWRVGGGRETLSLRGVIPGTYLDLVWIVTYLKCVNRIEFNELLGV